MSLQLSAWGWSLGPRHLAPLIPFLVIAIGRLLQTDGSSARWTERALLMLVPLSIVFTLEFLGGLLVLGVIVGFLGSFLAVLRFVRSVR